VITFDTYKVNYKGVDVKLLSNYISTNFLHKTPAPFLQILLDNLLAKPAGGGISQYPLVIKIIKLLDHPKKPRRQKRGVYNNIMNTILAICSEYSDNVWYSGFEGNSIPTKIAIEIEREYKFHFLKLMTKFGYELESLKRGDNKVCILTLNNIQSKILC